MRLFGLGRLFGRGVEHGRLGGLTGEEIFPGEFLAFALAFLRELQALGRDRKRLSCLSSLVAIAPSFDWSNPNRVCQS